jgi:hypothetical protein
MDIKVGDLVMVVKPKPCGCAGSIGKLFIVTGFDRRPVVFLCSSCGHEWGETSTPGVLGLEDKSINPARLIKIDPPALPESLEREKEIAA